MDRIECFVAGRKLAMGVIKNDTIEAHGDDFESPSHLFQTLLNSISPPSEYQLHFVRALLHGVSNPLPDHSVQ